MNRRITILALIVFLLAACAAQAEPIKLAYKFTRGGLDKYRVNMTVNMTLPSMPGTRSMSPISMSMEMLAWQRTLAVLPDGSAKLKITYSVPKVKLAGAANGRQPVLPKQSFSVVMTMAPDGRLLGIEGMERVFALQGAGNLDVSQFSNLMGQYVFLPSEPVEVGTRWTQTVPMPFDAGEMTVDSVLQSYGERVWSLTTAAINQKFGAHMDLGRVVNSVVDSAALGPKERQMMSQVSGSLDLNGTMTFYFSPTLGKILKGNGQIWASFAIGMPKEAVKQGAPAEVYMTMDMNMTVSRCN